MIMKKTINWIGLVLIMMATMFSLQNCKDAEEIADKLTHFTFGTEYTFKVPATSIVNVPLSVVTPEIETKSDVMFSNNQTRADLVERINLSQLTLTVITPGDGSLKFVKSIEIKAAAAGLPEVRVAYKDNVPNDIGKVLNLDVTLVELKEYFTKDKYTLRITVVTDEAVPEEYTIKADGLFFVDAKILGQ
jgi:hypothetical protein